MSAPPCTDTWGTPGWLRWDRAIIVPVRAGFLLPWIDPPYARVGTVFSLENNKK